MTKARKFYLETLLFLGGLPTGCYKMCEKFWTLPYSSFGSSGGGDIVRCAV